MTTSNPSGNAENWFSRVYGEVWAKDINMEAISIWVFKAMTLDDHQGNIKRKVNQGLSTSTSKAEDESY